MKNPRRLAYESETAIHDHQDEIELTLASDDISVKVTHDGFSIGSHRYCDLMLVDASIPPRHSVIHNQSGAVWIEADNEAVELVVNNRHCRRLSLRNGDQVQIGPNLFQVELRLAKPGHLEATTLQQIPTEDVTELSAEELCDRIAIEQSMIEELSEDDQSGWDALLTAIEAAHGQSQGADQETRHTISLVDENVAFESVFGQIQDLQATLADRPNLLKEQDPTVIASTVTVVESQQRANDRLDEIIDQLTKSDVTTELRASA